MSEYYHYDTQDDFDFNNDEMYDYVLERESLKQLDNVDSRCALSGGEEHFGNLKKSQKSTIFNLFISLIIIIIIYFTYIWLCDSNKMLLPAGNYIAKLNY